MSLSIALINICKEIVHNLIRFTSIKIIRIYCQEWLVYKLFCRKQRLPCSPRLGTPLWNFKSLRQIIHFLIYIVNRNSCFFFEPVAYDFHKIIFNIFSYNDDNLVKPGLYCIKYAIIHNYFAIRSKSIKLFNSAISASHTRCHYY